MLGRRSRMLSISTANSTKRGHDGEESNPLPVLLSLDPAAPHIHWTSPIELSVPDLHCCALGSCQSPLPWTDIKLVGKEVAGLGLWGIWWLHPHLIVAFLGPSNYSLQQ
ncbi:hypothetical protein ZIOFF_005330 [Zingiber officinale]|uniref:Uncharacterized protein n=1 Tax=Zingiber officinale TaxID=94328 RepID=A0A8J5I1C2_ZINOF|nr:hypothetical protein ZIOFF_005330 [Zingiber officinale]